MRYTAFVHKDPDSAYGVSFPDVPGCISASDTIDEAVRNAVEALSGHVRMLEADGDPVLPRAISTRSWRTTSWRKIAKAR